MRLWCAVPMPEKFIVQLSAVVIRQASPAQNMTCLRCEVGVLRKRWGTFRKYLTGKGHCPPTIVGVEKLE